MNDVINHIISRRSIRKYTKDTVSKETIELLLTAAMSGPSACNQQDWHFYVITDSNKLEKLSTLHNGLRFVKDAPVAILICSNPEAATLDYYWIDDCSIATQNILLAAHSLGLGAIWTGINHNDPSVAKLYSQIVGVSENHVPFALVPIGYPAETKTQNQHYDDKKITWDSLS